MPEIGESSPTGFEFLNNKKGINILTLDNKILFNIKGAINNNDKYIYIINDPKNPTKYNVYINIGNRRKPELKYAAYDRRTKSFNF